MHMKLLETISRLRGYIKKSNFRAVIFMKDSGRGNFELSYPTIALHAISRDISRFSKPCLFFQIEPKVQRWCRLYCIVYELL